LDDSKNNIFIYFKRIYEDYNTYLYVLLFAFGAYWSVASPFVNAGIDKLKQVISCRLQNRQLMLLRKLAPKEFQAPCLVVTTRLDEPYWWLRGWVGAAALPHLLWGVLGTCTKSLPILIGLVVLTQCTADSWVSEKDAFYDMGLLTSSILGVLTLYLSTMLVFLVMLVLPPILLGPWGFGWSGFLSTWLVKIAPRNLPAGSMRSRATIFHFNNRPRSIFKLRHSALHSDPRAIDAVVNWLSGTEANSRWPAYRPFSQGQPGPLVLYESPIEARVVYTPDAEWAVAGPPSSIPSTPNLLSVRSNDATGKLAYLRLASAGFGVLIGAFVITHNFYLQQQLPINEVIPEMHGETMQAELSRIDLVSIIRESLPPGKSITKSFDLGKFRSVANCFIVGDYGSDNSSLMLIMIAVVWKPISQDYKLKDPPYNLLSQRRWFEAGGKNLLARADRDSTDRRSMFDSKGRVRSKELLERMHESVSTEYRTLYSSEEHEHRKRVHFERKLDLADQDVRGSGVVIKNRGKQELAIFDLDVSARCPSK
jgi:hypothetical protein